MVNQQHNSQEIDGYELDGQDGRLSQTISNSTSETMHFATSLQTTRYQTKEVLMVQKSEGTNAIGGQTADG